MSRDLILDTVRAFDGVLDLAPEAGSDFPEIAWGDHFFYYAPDGVIPDNRQPYATIVTKDYPGDEQSKLDEPGRWRLNVHVGAPRFSALTGEEPPGVSAADFSVSDTILPHPVYGSLGWIAVVNPGERTTDAVIELLRAAHDDEKRRFERRTRDSTPGA